MSNTCIDYSITLNIIYNLQEIWNSIPTGVYSISVGLLSLIQPHKINMGQSDSKYIAGVRPAWHVFVCINEFDLLTLVEGRILVDYKRPIISGFSRKKKSTNYPQHTRRGLWEPLLYNMFFRVHLSLSPNVQNIDIIKDK